MPRQTSKPIYQDETVSVMERSNGFYWRLNGEKRLRGPHASLLEVVDDIDARTALEQVPAESCVSLEEAEDEIGVAGWIDPDTGLPAEDGAHRLELH
ncbi:MAG: hypothetical protein A3H35_17000 [Betaproteobacteria bacterium RIFCSPLOWO2_02_FULL_62_17]|nr:MAG: hypothetical protein A3H35_17000 [Betaproteobacteria bacterium RIFCSPLOWO2_02_FULL_62_17]